MKYFRQTSYCMFYYSGHNTSIYTECLKKIDTFE